MTSGGPTKLTASALAKKWDGLLERGLTVPSYETVLCPPA